jgi:hypothetical protein
MTADRAAKAFLNFRHVGDVIEMAMSKDEQPDLSIHRIEPGARSIRRIEQDQALRGLKQVAIGLKNAAAKTLIDHDLQHFVSAQAAETIQSRFKYLYKNASENGIFYDL